MWILKRLACENRFFVWSPLKGPRAKIGERFLQTRPVTVRLQSKEVVAQENCFLVVFYRLSSQHYLGSLMCLSRITMSAWCHSPRACLPRPWTTWSAWGQGTSGWLPRRQQQTWQGCGLGTTSTRWAMTATRWSPMRSGVGRSSWRTPRQTISWWWHPPTPGAMASWRGPTSLVVLPHWRSTTMTLTVWQILLHHLWLQ